MSSHGMGILYNAADTLTHVTFNPWPVCRFFPSVPIRILFGFLAITVMRFSRENKANPLENLSLQT